MNKGDNLSIAIILDGNRRYAEKRGLKPWQGHKFGAEKIKDLLKWCRELCIKELTLYTFSTDNFNRSEQEKKVLFLLFKESIRKLKND
ncbi:MAG: undecaprenyl diphosphate synthase family protein, partial [Candidatus Omnitrophica bacterium]|nr:undecaprenyl diphosphate synthase family protein [Candidatus Omnitrophota bacterium]